MTQIAPTIRPELTVSHGDTFLVTDRDGQVRAGRAGLYHRDVRYLDGYRYTINGADPVLLTATNTDFHRSQSFFTNPELGGYRTQIPAGVLVMELDREIDRERLVERWEIRSFRPVDARFSFSVALRATFDDIFEVRGLARRRRRVVFGEWDRNARELRYRYRDRDYERELRIRVDPADNGRIRCSADELSFDIVLAPRGTWVLSIEIGFEPATSGADVRKPTEESEEREGPDRLHALLPYPVLRCGSDDVERVWQQMRADVTSLHLRPLAGSYVPAAGVPWFATLFGRDSIVSAYQLVHGNSGPARATLLQLAEFQYDGPVDPAREAEPGKMPHELRDGELAHFRVPPQRPAYTTADATLLYPILLHETWRWTGDAALVRDLLPVAERCLEWAARYGDRDEDGLQEFIRARGQTGYRQMGWKDSDDSCVDARGRVPEGPYALVELQGYWYDALVRMAELRERVAERDGTDLRRTAEELRARIEDRFWMEEAGCYAFALDGRKEQVASVASNTGHLLWSGVPGPDRARLVAERLLRPDMWSGWGVRTLSRENPAFNPISYHRGSVWPHDNSLIAFGMRRYGLGTEAARVAEGILAAATRFEHGSLPEVWSGITRERAPFPVPYLDANRPQAWAAASPALLLRAILGLEADPLRRRLTVDPGVPEALGEVDVDGIEVLGARVRLRARGRTAEVVSVDGDVEVSGAAR